MKLVTLLAFERFGCERLQLIPVEGYVGDGAHRLYGMLPDDDAALPWLVELRACTTLVDALGGRQ